jgi:ectoine hydroxylase-related dioxygenase (phytanoyl-CoA dioxygenase family)
VLNINFQLHNHGFEVRRAACPPSSLTQLQSNFPTGATPTSEALMDAVNPLLQSIAAEFLGSDCHPLEATLCSSSATAEPWHQATINTSNHNNVLILRLSLDDTTFFDGALKLCPSSHKHGVLTEREVRGHSIRPFSSPEMKAGDLLILHPLTIHATAASTTNNPTRVIQILYAKP